MIGFFSSLDRQAKPAFLTIYLLCAVICAPTLVIVTTSHNHSIQRFFEDILGNPQALAQQLTNQTPMSRDYINPLLPSSVLPDFSINFSCNQSQTDTTRTIEFTYINRTSFRINLTRSSLRVGGITINPYSFLDETSTQKAQEAGLRLVHTHTHSDLMYNPTSSSYLQRKDVLLLPNEEQNQWLATGSSGPIDYLEPGSHTAMIIEVPKQTTVVWTAGVSYTQEQRDLSGRSQLTKTTTASKGNFKPCLLPQTTGNGLTIDEPPASQESTISGELESTSLESEKLQSEFESPSVGSQTPPTKQYEDSQTIHQGDLSNSLQGETQSAPPLVNTLQPFVSGFTTHAQSDVSTQTLGYIELGDLDIYSFCKQHIHPQFQHSLTGDTPETWWTCGGVEIDENEVCRWQYNNAHAFSFVTDKADTGSLVCLTLNGSFQLGDLETLGDLDLWRYCSEMYGEGTISYPTGSTPETWWTCGMNRPINLTNVCQWQYGTADVFHVVQNIYNPYSIVCAISMYGNTPNHTTNPIDPIPDPIPEPVIEYIDLPDTIEIYSEDDILSQDYIVSLDENNTQNTLLSIIELMDTITVTNALLDGEIFNHIYRLCGKLDFSCKTNQSIAMMNMSRLVASFFLGIGNGTQSAVVSYFQILQLLSEFPSMVQGLINLIGELMRDRYFIGTLILPIIRDFNTKNLYDRFYTIGYIMGELVPDLALELVLILTPVDGPVGEGVGGIVIITRRTATILSEMTDVIALSGRAVRLSAYLIGLSMRFGDEVITFINVGGKAGIKADDVLGLVDTVDDAGFTEAAKMIDDQGARRKVEMYREDIKLCGTKVANLSSFDVFFGTVEAEAKGLCPNWKVIFLKKFGNHPHYSKLPLDDAPGEYKFVPKVLNGGLPDVERYPSSRGYGPKDADGNIWVVGYDGVKQDNLHFDVQHPNNLHSNVSPNGTINHAKNNFIYIPKY